MLRELNFDSSTENNDNVLCCMLEEVLINIGHIVFLYNKEFFVNDNNVF